MSRASPHPTPAQTHRSDPAESGRARERVLLQVYVCVCVRACVEHSSHLTPMWER